jgi:hypothetical protein
MLLELETKHHRAIRLLRARGKKPGPFLMTAGPSLWRERHRDLDEFIRVVTIVT